MWLALMVVASLLIETGEAEAVRASARLMRAVVSNFMMDEYGIVEIGK
jgi:hypothetical protein